MNISHADSKKRTIFSFHQKAIFFAAQGCDEIRTSSYGFIDHDLFHFAGAKIATQTFDFNNEIEKIYKSFQKNLNNAESDVAHPRASAKMFARCAGSLKE